MSVMEAFSALLEKLYFTSSTHAKSAILQDYLKHTPDPDRGWAIAAIAGTLSFDLFKRQLIKQLITERVDSYLYELSYDYVGETSETVAHLWEPSPSALRLNRLPSLHEVVEHFTHASKQGTREYLTLLLDNMSAPQRWALIKLGTRGLRIGMSARLLKKILAEYGCKDITEIETLWHGLNPPYTELLLWLEGKAEKPQIAGKCIFHPVMLSHTLEETDRASLATQLSDWQIEWKYDGVRVQWVSQAEGMALFTRTGDDISHSFPEILPMNAPYAVLDGELLVMRGNAIGSFNELQQRLNKKAPTKKLIESHPGGLMLYDALKLDDERVTHLPLRERRQALRQWLERNYTTLPFMQLSPVLQPEDALLLENLRAETMQAQDSLIEGLMLKKLDSPYIPGRPKGYWFKWKRDARTIDAVMMYAQRGHGKRSSYYSDYTFGLWQDGQVIPIGKAYSGFTDEELKKLDKWIRAHTINRFGSVREVEKSLVLEVAFDAVHPSSRHKSGLALRFPRIHRIRWDKPAGEAAQLEELKKMV